MAFSSGRGSDLIYMALDIFAEGIAQVAGEGESLLFSIILLMSRTGILPTRSQRRETC